MKDVGCWRKKVDTDLTATGAIAWRLACGRNSWPACGKSKRSKHECLRSASKADEDMDKWICSDTACSWIANHTQTMSSCSKRFIELKANNRVVMTTRETGSWEDSTRWWEDLPKLRCSCGFAPATPQKKSKTNSRCMMYPKISFGCLYRNLWGASKHIPIRPHIYIKIAHPKRSQTHPKLAKNKESLTVRHDAFIGINYIITNI